MPTPIAFLTFTTSKRSELDAFHGLDKARERGPHNDALDYYNRDGSIQINCHTGDVDDFLRSQSTFKLESDVIDNPDEFIAFFTFLSEEDDQFLDDPVIGKRLSPCES